MVKSAQKRTTQPERTTSLWPRRGLLLALALVMLVGVLAGLARLGLPLPGFLGLGLQSKISGGHGPLMVLGVFGAVISLERAVAVGTSGQLGPAWSVVTLFTPTLFAGSALAALVWPAARAGQAVAALGLVLLNAVLFRHQKALFTGLLLLGSIVLFFGTTRFVFVPSVFWAVPTWMTFFILTIVAERLDLSRLAPTPAWAFAALAGLSVLLAVLACASVFFPGTFLQGFGAVIFLVALWQLRFDIARRTWRRRGLPAYAATGVMLGAVWLAVTGLLLLFYGLAPAGGVYDATLHSLFVGYVLSMVFAHAPIIFPAVAQVTFPFSRALYGPLLLLHVGLLVRVFADLAGQAQARVLGSVASSVSLPLFLLTAVAAAIGSGAVKRKGQRDASGCN